MKKILIASPAQDTVLTYYSTSVVKSLIYLFNQSFPHAIEVDYDTVFATYIHEGRNSLVKHAQSVNATHILWVDTDMLFPTDTFYRLIMHDVDFVGVNYSTRRMPFRYTAGKWNEKDSAFDQVITSPTSTGLEKVDTLGFGICLMSMNIFDKLEKPWFDYKYDHKLDIHMGEDYLFCKNVREFTDIYLDHDLSKMVKHVGTYPYHYLCPIGVPLSD
jgi:hypothetical protein